MVYGKSKKTEGRSLHKAVMADLRETEMSREYFRELHDLYHFYLDNETRARLDGMGRIWRTINLLGWILKSLLLKLSGPRRILLLVALVLVILGKPTIEILGRGVTTDLRPWGFLVLLVVLMLELKDKLLARDEIQIAKQVQVALFPRFHPELPGWALWSYSRAAKEVGGDLVDYIELDGFRHGVLLGDVAGKGLGAALLSAKLQATLRALVPDAISLEDLGTRVNTIFFRDGISNRYATLFYAEIEYHSGSMRWLNAGHNPALIVRADGLERLNASSFPVGMMEKTSYAEGSSQLEVGDILFGYSDGLTEAENAAGEEFGMERLEALLPELRGLDPETVGRRVLDEADRFLGDSKVTDDLSLIVVVKK